MNKDYPVALGLTDHGWVAIYETPNKYKGTRFEDVLWLQPPSDELVAIIEPANGNLQATPNLLVPDVWRKLDLQNTDLQWNLDRLHV